MIILQYSVSVSSFPNRPAPQQYVSGKANIKIE